MHSVSGQPITDSTDTSEKLIFEDKGYSKHDKIFRGIMAFIMLADGIFLFLLAQAKSSTVYVNGRYFSGGRNIFDDGTRSVLTFAGIAMAVVCVLIIQSVIYGSKSYMKLYENHMEGVKYTAFFFKREKRYSLEYNQITSIKPFFVDILKKKLNMQLLIITKLNGAYRLTVNNYEKVSEILHEKAPAAQTWQ